MLLIKDYHIPHRKCVRLRDRHRNQFDIPGSDEANLIICVLVYGLRRMEKGGKTKVWIIKINYYDMSKGLAWREGIMFGTVKQKIFFINIHVYTSYHNHKASSNNI